MSRNACRALPSLLLALLLPGAAGAAEPSKEVRKTLSLPAGGRVAVDTYKGSVTVTAEERPDVSVEARVTPDTTCGSDKDQAEWVSGTDVKIDSSGKTVRIESDYGKLESHHFWFFGSCTSRPFVDYRIRMPRKADLDVKDYKSKIDVTGLAGELSVDSYKGTIRVQDLAGSIRLNTYKGEATVAIASLTSASRLETYKGEIEVSLPKSAPFDLDADAGRRGDFRSGFGTSLSSGGRAAASVNGGGPRLSFSTYKGSLKLTAR